MEIDIKNLHPLEIKVLLNYKGDEITAEQIGSQLGFESQSNQIFSWLSGKELIKEKSRTLRTIYELTELGAEYKAKGKPQQKHIEAPQKPIGGNSGELAGNGKENAPEDSKQPDIKKEELPTIYDDAINKAKEQQVFYNAIQKGWMELNGTTYKWMKNKEYLALMCGLLYWGDEVKDDRGAKIDEWGEYPKTLSKSKHRFNYESGECKKTSKDIKDLFGGVDVSNLRSQLSELPDEYGSITRLFPTD